MAQRRSSEELDMRRAVEKWGRAKWPGSRVVHELVVEDCRVDVAFIQTDHIAAVEIKSSKDTLKRLDKQMRKFTTHIPEVWIAFAPIWHSAVELDDWHNTICTTRERVDDDHSHIWCYVDRVMTSPMLTLLWRDELAAIASRKRLSYSRRSRMQDLAIMISRKLTGDEIVTEVCRELRGRDAFATGSDEPIKDKLGSTCQLV
jgi:hypothetical protein